VVLDVAGADADVDAILRQGRPETIRVAGHIGKEVNLALSEVRRNNVNPVRASLSSGTYYTSKPVLISRRGMKSYHCPARAGRTGLAVPVGWHYLFENVSLDRPYQGNGDLTGSASVGSVAVVYLRMSDNNSLN
jgi:hypothetical protein